MSELEMAAASASDDVKVAFVDLCGLRDQSFRRTLDGLIVEGIERAMEAEMEVVITDEEEYPVWLPDSLYSAVEALAEEEGKDTTEVIRMALTALHKLRAR